MPNTTRVLLVDDDEAMLESMAAVLADELVLVTCSSARAALAVLRGTG
jgi:DNA-binding NtrC family response regulator